MSSPQPVDDLQSASCSRQASGLYSVLFEQLNFNIWGNFSFKNKYWDAGIKRMLVSSLVKPASSTLLLHIVHVLLSSHRSSGFKPCACRSAHEQRTEVLLAACRESNREEAHSSLEPSIKYQEVTEEGEEMIRVCVCVCVCVCVRACEWEAQVV